MLVTFIMRVPKGSLTSTCCYLSVSAFQAMREESLESGSNKATSKSKWSFWILKVLSHTHMHTHRQKGSDSHYSVPFTLQKYIHSYKICYKFLAISLNLHLAAKSAASVSDLKKACLLFPSISLLIKNSTCACVFLTNLSDYHTYENMPLGWYFKAWNGIQMFAGLFWEIAFYYNMGFITVLVT